MARLRLATVWLGGCSGCHMSFLDLDEWLIDLADQVDLVYSPLVDVKEYPQQVDLVLIEGAIANTDHVELLQQIRRCTRTLVAFGDCAVTGNVTALRNHLGDPALVLRQVYAGGAERPIPSDAPLVPELTATAQPLHTLVSIDVFLPGCPPSAARIRVLLEQVLAGETPHLAGRDQIKFG